MKVVQSTNRQDVKDFVLLQILNQLSMIWCPISVLSIPMHLFKYVDSIAHATNTTWGTYIFNETFDTIEKLWYYELTGIKKPVMGSTLHIVVGIDIRREVPQPDFTDINKESEVPLPGKVSPTEDFPLANTTNIDMEREGPRPKEVPPLEADIFFEDEEVPLNIKMNKRKREPMGEVSSPVMELQTCTG
ncbi:uncharacterized protein A4U43_C04F15970 [Asparagus officinalis]|uniref:Uncharacterized protein n=1 Tax=Asparagus officinalis TaxID=4686 RepID=A0A5P1F1Q4_ASPOF|nr:uncharacterized protein A4U43_C04F15970 [Asparagus officinalis]